MIDVDMGHQTNNEFLNTRIDSQNSVNEKLCDYQWAKYTEIDPYILYTEGIVTTSTPLDWDIT